MFYDLWLVWMGLCLKERVCKLCYEILYQDTIKKSKPSYYSFEQGVLEVHFFGAVCLSALPKELQIVGIIMNWRRLLDAKRDVMTGLSHPYFVTVNLMTSHSFECIKMRVDKKGLILLRRTSGTKNDVITWLIFKACIMHTHRDHYFEKIISHVDGIQC